jgi:streptogramin lyase
MAMFSRLIGLYLRATSKKPLRLKRRLVIFPRLELLEDRALLTTTSTTLTTSVNPAVFGQPVTLSAVVSPTPPATGFPLGSVTFNNNGVSIGSATLQTPFSISEFSVPTGTSQPVGVAAGSDGRLWFTEFNANKIGRLTTAGAFTEFTVPTAGSGPQYIAAGPDGNLWFTEFNGNKIGRITTAGAITEFTVPTAGSSPDGITAGPDGNLWFTEEVGDKIGKITTAGAFTQFTVPTANSDPVGITAGPDGNLWFTEETGNKIGKITTAGTFTQFTVPTASSNPLGIAAGADSNLWFTEASGNKIGRITTAGSFTEFSVPLSGSEPFGIIGGRDGNLYATDAQHSQLLQVSTSGTMIQFVVPTSSSVPEGITNGPDGAIWFAEHNGNKIGQLDNRRIATTTVSSLTTGTHTLSAVYGGDLNFSSSTSGNLLQTITTANSTTTLASSQNPSVFSQFVTFTATVSGVSPSTALVNTGTVTFRDGGVSIGSAAVSNGSATFTTSSLTIATHTITASYSDGTSYNSSASGNFLQTVTKASTSTALTSSANPVVFGQSVTFTATVSAISPATGTPTGTVTFRDGATSIGSGTLASGTATLTSTTLTVGSHTITAVYGGNANFNSSTSAAITQTVNKAASSSTVVSSANPAVFGQAVTFTATVAAVAPGAGTPTGTVTFRDGTTSIGSGTLASGKATFTSSVLTVGSHSITVAYSGDANFNASSATRITQTISKADSSVTVTSSANPSVFGQPVTFSATVAAVSPGAGTPTGSVTFLDGGVSIGTRTLASGKATFASSTLTVGSHTITVTYGGDANFNTSAGAALTQSVNKASSSTAASSSLNPSVFGQAVTFTATVAAVAPGTGTPTGTVTFQDGGISIGSGTLASGKATFASSALTVGLHTITVVYGGDANFSTSTCIAITQTVGAGATSTAIATSVNPSNAGQSVTFTATVTASSPAAGTPTGTVIFNDGGASIGSGILAGGSASFSTSSLIAGSHTVTAAYAGNANFGSSGSAAITQTVNGLATSTTLAGSTNPTQFGQSAIFTATVTPMSGSGTPTGTVTFSDGGTSIGSSTLVSGSANFSTATLSVGTHTITASYAGDASFGASTSAALTQTVNATSLTVFSLADTYDNGTLRAAILAANANGGSNTIDFDPSLTLPGTIVLALGQLPDIRNNLTITGPGETNLTIDAHGASRIFTIDAGFTVNISGLTIANGHVVVDLGGGILNHGTLTLTNSTVSGNSANGTFNSNGVYFASGGGIFSDGTLTLTNSTVAGNSGNYLIGGGICNNGNLTLTGSTISGNSGGRSGHGGGIRNNGTATVSDSTISGNYCNFEGGGILNFGNLTVSSSTVTGNTCGFGGGGINNYAGNLMLTNSTVSDNSTHGSPYGGGGIFNLATATVSESTISDNEAAGPEGGGIQNLGGGTLTVCDSTLSGNFAGAGGAIYNGAAFPINFHHPSTFTSRARVTNSTISGNSGGNGSGITCVGNSGGNYFAAVYLNNSIVANGNGANGDLYTFGGGTITGANNITGHFPLPPLANNGGPTQTMALLPGSPAIDAGNPALAPATDQRGVVRDSAPDIGAFESRGFTLAVASGDNQSAPVSQPFANPLVVTVSSPFGDPVQGGTVTFTAPASGPGVTFSAGNTATIDASGHATCPVVANDQLGTYSVTAMVNGVTLVSFTLTNLPATTTALTSSVNPSVFGQSVTFTATVTPTSGSGTPTGTVTFTDGAATLGSSALSGGVATLTTSLLSAGAHLITATYAGDANFGGSSTIYSRLVLADSPSAYYLLNDTSGGAAHDSSGNGADATYFGPVSRGLPGPFVGATAVQLDGGSDFIILPSAPFGNYPTSGSTTNYSLTFETWFNAPVGSLGGVILGQLAFGGYVPAVMLGMDGKIRSSLFWLGSGANIITSPSTYNDGNWHLLDTTYSNGTQSLYIDNILIGTQSFAEQAYDSNGYHYDLGTGNTAGWTGGNGGGFNFVGVLSQAAIYPTALSPDQIGAHYTAAQANQTVNQASTSMTVASSINPSALGQAVTFTATVSVVAPGAGTPTGTITFLDGSTSIGTGALSGGSATFTTSALAAGTHTITATYSGDTNFTTSAGPAITQTVSSGVVSTTMTLDSSNNPSVFGQSVTFTATVSPTSGSGTPTGTVDFFVDGSDVSGPVSLAGGSASFSTSSLMVGTHSVAAIYSGDSNYSTSTSAIMSQTVNQDSTTTSIVSSANPSVFGQSVTFTATVAANSSSNVPSGTVTFEDGGISIGSGTLSGGSASLATSALAAGTHTITVSYSGDANFTGSTSNALTQTVNKADAAISVSGYSVTYDGDAHTASGSATGVLGESLAGLDLSGTTHTSPGTYSDSWTFTDITGNYNNGSGTVTDSIGKANATISVSGYSVTYDGNAHTAPGSATGVKGESLVGLDLSGTTHTSAGTYSDGWTFTDVTGNYNNASGTVTDSIAKANAVISVSGYSVTYDGNAHTASGSATGVKGESLAGLDLSGTTHTSAGTYSDSWTFTDVTGNYNNATGTVTDSVAKADAVISVSGYSVTFDGSAHTASGSATGVKGESLPGLDLSGTTHTSAGTYSDSWTFTDVTGNYNNASGTVSDSIAQADTSSSVVSSVNPASFGQSVTFTATVTSAAGTPSGTVTFLDAGSSIGAGTLSDGSSTFSTSGLAVGAHTITATYGGDSNFSTSAAPAMTQTVSSGIVSTTTALSSSANPSVYGQSVTFTATVSPTSGSGTPSGTVTFTDGAATVGTGTLSGGTASFSTANLSAGSHTITVSYSGDASFTGSTSNALTQTVNKATAVISVSGYSVTYDGNAHSASGSATGVKGESLAGLDLSGTTHTNAGTYSDSWTFTDVTGNYNDASGSVTDSIAKANAVISVSGYSITYDGNAHTASGSATGVKGESLAGLDLSGTTHTNAGAYSDSWTFTDVTGNYNNANGTVGDSIGKANASNSVSGYSVTYDGNAHSASGSATGVKGESLAGLDLSGTTHTNAGTYSDSWTFTDITGNYNNANGTVSDSIAQASTLISVVSSINPSAFGQSVTFTATVGSSAGTPTGTVVFSDGGVSIGSATLSGGQATLATSSLAVGSHSIVATYSGSSNYSASTSNTVAQTVISSGRSSTTTTITGTSNPSAPGQAVTFTITVAPITPGSGTPTGTVKLTLPKATLGTVTLDSTGHATFTISTLPNGTNTITATYSGDSNFLTSSGKTIQTVGATAASTITLVSSNNPSVFGALVTFTATVTGAGDTPTGVVSFIDAKITLATVSLNSSGVATFTTSSLSIGTHNMHAAYSGSSQYNTSSSNVVSQTITASTSSTLVASQAGNLAAALTNPVRLVLEVGLPPAPAGSQRSSVDFAGAKPNGSASIVEQAMSDWVADQQRPQDPLQAWDLAAVDRIFSRI